MSSPTSARFKELWNDPRYREQMLKTLADARASLDDRERARALARTQRTKRLKRLGSQALQ